MQGQRRGFICGMQGPAGSVANRRKLQLPSLDSQHYTKEMVRGYSYL